MTDYNLLRAAAKAASIQVQLALGLSDADAALFHNGKEWNPLVDDGDALRLAVRMGLNVSPYNNGIFVSRYECEPVIREAWVGDGEMSRAETTRRAIVRAAAAMADDAKPE